MSEYSISFSYAIKSNKNRPHTLKENVRVLDHNDNNNNLRSLRTKRTRTQQE